MAHPLLNRRDLTAQREQVGHAVPAAPDLGGLAGELAETNRLLRATLQQHRADLTELCVTDREPAQAAMDNFPVAGAKRLIVRRAGAGSSTALQVNVPALILPANENRLGGLIVNAGANPATLFISSDLLTPGSANPLTEGAAQIVLAANGGSWNMLLGRVLWCGNVIALAAVATTISVAEI